MLKFLTDENIATFVVKELRARGYDVKDIKEAKFFGISDKEVLGMAKKEGRIVITHDKDFANMIINPNQKHSGVIIIRFYDQSPENVAKKLLLRLAEIKNKAKGSVVIVSDEYIKIL